MISPLGSPSSRSRIFVEPHVGGSPPAQESFCSPPRPLLIPSSSVHYVQPLLSPPRSDVAMHRNPLVQPSVGSPGSALKPSADFVNPGNWEYHAVLPNTTSVYGVGREDNNPAPFHRAAVVLHKRRTAHIPSTIPESSAFLGQLEVETTQWKLGINNPYISLRDDVDHTDAILEELQAIRVEHAKRDIVATQKPPSNLLHSRKKYLKARKAKYIPHFGVVPYSRSSFPYVPSHLHCATLFNRHSNFIVSPSVGVRFPPLTNLTASLVKPVYQPQFGNSVTASISRLRELADFQNLPLPDNLLSRVEDLVLFYMQIREVSSTPQLIAILMAYYKTFVSGSLLRSIETYVHELFPTILEGQSGTSDPDWLKCLREGKTNWTILTQCAAFEKISQLLSLCVTLGMCQASQLSFSLGSFKLFSVEAQRKHATALDLIDAFANTIFYFVEGGYRVFTSGSITPLIYSDFEAKLFDDDCNTCERNAEFAKTGDLERLGATTTNEFDNLIVNTLDKGHQLMNLAKSPSEKAIFRSRIERLRRIQTELTQTRLTTGLRKAPFVASFFGSSAQGKSTIAKICMTTLLEANGYESSPEYICGVNETDKFMSTYRSCVNGVFVDDVCNAKPDFVDRPPSQILIDLNNNVPSYALQAEADKKGKVVIDPKVVICTTNVKDLGATIYSNEPVSIARRANVHVTTRVRPQYATNGMLDSTKVWQFFPDASQPIQDIWELTLQTVKAIPSISRNGVDSIGWENIVFDGKPMVDVGIEEALKCLVSLSRTHFLNQEKVVQSANAMRDNIKVCKNCGLPHIYCKCPTYGPYFPGEMQGIPPGCTCDETTVCGLCKEFSEQPITCPDCKRLQPTDRMKGDPDWTTEIHEKYFCKCSPYEGQFGSLLAAGIRHIGGRWLFGASKKVSEVGQRLEEYSTARLLQIAYMLENSWVSKWTNWLPQAVIKADWCQNLIAYMERDSIVAYAKREATSAALISGFGLLWFFFNRSLPAILPHAVLTAIHLRDKFPIAYSVPIFWFSSGAPMVAISAPVAIGSSIAAIAAQTTLTYTGRCYDVPWCKFHPLVIVFSCTFLVTAHLCKIVKCRDIVVREIVARNDAIPTLAKSVREKYVTTLLKYAALVGVIYTLVKIWQHLRIVPDGQGSIEPRNLEDIEERDAQANPWALPEVKAFPCSLKSKSVTHSTLVELVFNNLAHMACDINGAVHSCDAFFPFSNVAIIPHHAWSYGPILKANFTRKDPTTVGANFTSFLSQEQSIHIPGTDFSLVWVPNGGDWKDLRPYFPLAKFGQCAATLVYKDHVGAQRLAQTIMLPGIQSTAVCSDFNGAAYILPWNTFKGLCISPLVTQTRGPTIGGFHIGGIANTGQGCSGLLTIAELDAAASKLADLPGVVLSVSSGNLRKTIFDVQWYESPNIHPKSPLNFMPVGMTSAEPLGSCIGRAKYFSEVVTLPISQSVEKHMGVGCLWGKPKFSTKAWRESLLGSMWPSIGVEPPLLTRAYADYVNQLDSILLDPKWSRLLETTKPLTNMQTVCGIDGKRFVDKMPPNTSVGFPLSGPKSQYLELLDPADFPEFNCPAMLDSKFWDEWTHCEKCYLDGERAYPIFKACLKDEPTKLTKDKVRVFQAAPMSLQLGVRKYFLPLARILSLFPTVSECAVGINAQSPEWHVLMQHVGRFGSNTLAGDYHKYDLTMPAQLMFAGFRVLMHIAQRCGYTEYDLIIMSGLATDICYPLMAYNGDLIQHYGSNPSGQNLTVYINCIVNSLLFRCGAISILGRKFTRFRDICSLITYGDDADSTVDPKFPEFNHLTYAQFLRERGMGFTPPDKSSTPTAYMSRSESHFLKRESKVLEGTTVMCGALEEGSIFKSLHCVLKSKAVSTMEQSICNLDGAAREFFFHGRSTYDQRIQQLQAVAADHALLHLCPGLSLSYDDRLDKWKEQYASDLERL